MADTSTTSQYKCVNCGAPSQALFRNYGPSVLKLTKCEECKNIVDKYVEYDPVIVMIDIVLVSKEAQRHVIYNTEFKSYWKLLVILMLLETYSLWKNDSLFNIAVNYMCDTNQTAHMTNFSVSSGWVSPRWVVPEGWVSVCEGWVPQERGDEMFLWEKDFYILFLSTFAGILLFLATVHGLMTLMTTCSTINKVSIIRLLKAFSVSNTSLLVTLPMLVWGADTQTSTKLLHYVLAAAYTHLVYFNVFSVVYGSGSAITMIIVAAASSCKHASLLLLTPRARAILA